VKHEDKFVLITGAGAGLGRCLTIELAAKGHNVALASLIKEELETVAAELNQKYPAIKVKTIAVDMLQTNAATTIAQWLDDEQININGLVNNVGFGYTGNYETIDAAFFSKLLQINVVFTHTITHAVVNKLIANQPSFILNVSSMAAHFPLPYKTLYSASKSFVLAFSKSLRSELWDKHVTVSCLCPGPMITNDEVRERIKNIGWRRHITSASEPEDIARIAIRGIQRKKAVILPTLSDKITVGIKAIIPPTVLAWLIRVLSKNSF
jgi:uncharacterized protein